MSDTTTQFPPAEALATLAQVLRQVARGHRLSREDAEDFLQSAQLKLIERDFEVFRRFKGRSSLRTYLVVVCTRLLLDWRIEQYGKWRPSAAALRLGEVAVLAERLIYRDGYTADAAFETVRVRYEAMDVVELQRIIDQVPPREGRRMVSDQVLDKVPARAAEDRLEVLQQEGMSRRIGDVLERALKALPPEEQRLIRGRYKEGRSISELARALGVEPAALYRRYESVLRRLRRALTDAGVTSPATITATITAGPLELDR